MGFSEVATGGQGVSYQQQLDSETNNNREYKLTSCRFMLLEKKKIMYLILKYLNYLVSYM